MKNKFIVVSILLTIVVIIESAFLFKPKEKIELIDLYAKGRTSNTIDLTLKYINSDRFKDSSVSYPYMDRSREKYNGLTEDQKKLYDEILENVKNFKEFSYLAKDYSYEFLDSALYVSGILLEDNPELRLYFKMDEITSNDQTIGLKATYFMPYDPDGNNASINKVKEEIAIFEKETDLIVQNMPSDLSTYDKYRYLATYISLKTSYDHGGIGGAQVANAYGGIEGGLSICEGYALAFEYLCKKANLWCQVVTGVVRNEAHAWNLVKLESGTYHVDVTWSDGDHTPISSNWYRYFMLFQEQILDDHEIDNNVVATGTRDFIMERG